MSYNSMIYKDHELSAYISKINSIPLLSKEIEFNAAIKWFNEKCVKSAHLLVTSHLKLVVKIAMKFSFCGLPIMDLVSEGNIGLMHAVRKFDPYKGFRLSTYAMCWIKAAIYEYMIKSWSLVKIGTTTTQKKLFYNLEKIKQKILHSDSYNGNLIECDEIKKISEQIGTTELDVKHTINRLSNPDQSLNTSNNDDMTEMLDMIEDTSQNQEANYITKQETLYKIQLIKNAVSKLNEREKFILWARHLSRPIITLEKIATKYSISCERVRQIENSVIKKIKSLMPKDKISLDNKSI